MKVSEKICKAAVIFVASTMSVLGAFSVLDRIDSIFRLQGVQVLAAGLAMPEHSDKNSDTDLNDKTTENKKTVSNNKSSVSSDTDYAEKNHSTDSQTDITDTNESTYLVTESLYRESNLSYDNFYVKNSTDLSIDLGSYLHAELPFEFENTSEPQVLIVHTHATESYMAEDLGYYYESFYPRDTDDNFNVVRVGTAITEKLQQLGIGAIHCTEHHDEPQYLGAYDNSAASIQYYMNEYPSIKIILDIHRDSITTDEGEKIKPTFTYNGKKAAQIMIMCGNDNYGYYDFPNWEQNMSLAVKLQSTAETKFPGMTRPLYFGNFMYNMNLAPGSLLIEVGTDANTLDEAVYSGEMLGEVIGDVLKSSI